MQPISIGKAVKKVMKDLGLYESYERQRALILWEKVCGKQAAQVSRAEKLLGDKLFIAVKDHIWASEMTHFAYTYLKRYSKLMGPGVINKIYFRAKPGGFDSEDKDGDEEEFNLESVELDDQEIKKVQFAVSGIEDETTRELAQKIFTKALKFDKWLLMHGGKKCFHCGVVIEKNMTFCPICVRELERENAGKLKEAFQEEPWLTFEKAIKKINPLSHSLFSEVKTGIIEGLEESIDSHMSKKNKENIDSLQVKSEIITLAMLATEKPPSKLSDKVLNDYLPTRLYRFYKEG
ncbi:MAG: DUF721 domain-containing protein [Candidatus Eremiobacteraeota bacterium]|nr:DUF721 domain-containing protein [Candidatus Eremiobacteraeota bacterium]